MEYVKYLPYIILFVSVYLLIFYWPTSKKLTLAQTLKTNKEQDSRFIVFLKKKKFYKWISPAYILKESKNYNWDLTKKDYIILFATGALAGSILLYSFFLSIYITLLAGIVGLALPHVVGFYKKKQYEYYVQEQLMIYLESLANAITVHEQVGLAINSIIPMMKSPIREEVEACLISYSSGQTVSEAFKPFVEKYNYKDIKLYHEMLNLLDETGKDKDGVLLQIAFEFQEKKVYREELRTGMQPKRRDFRNIVIMTATIPYLFLAVQAEDYILFAESLTGKIILSLIILINIFNAFKIEKHAFFDPTESITKIK